jgi:glutamine cyclotransferase
VRRFRGLALTLFALIAACRTPGVKPVAAEAPIWGVEIVAEYPHDPEAFTQGLLVADGRLYESTGNYRSSELREVEIETGRVLRRVALPGELFGEGLAKTGDRLIQLTWREQRALVWDLATLQRTGEHAYRGEG